LNYILAAFVLIFFKINLRFIDHSFFFYMTNLVGFFMVYMGIKSIGEDPVLKKMKPYVHIMVFHSFLFTILMAFGISYDSLLLSDFYYTVWSLVILAMVGMVLTLRIFILFTKYLKDNLNLEKKKSLFIDRLVEWVVLTFILAGIGFWIPEIRSFTMIMHLLVLAFLVIQLNACIRKEFRANPATLD